MAYIVGFDRSQITLFPATVEETIDENNVVRLVELFINGLDLNKFGFQKAIPSEEGRPSYHPSDLLKLYIYGYLNRIRTSRLLERECKRNIELIWLLKGLQPCFRTIAGFRSEHPQAFKNLFRHFVQCCRSWNLIDGDLVGIDSSKFRAVNSKKNNYNQAKIDRQVDHINEKIESYFNEMDQADAEQHDTLAEKIMKQAERGLKYDRLQELLTTSGADQISTTDPDSRSMILHGSVIEVAYNVQTAVDDKHKLIVHYEATNVNDRKALFPVAFEVKKICNKERISALADKGYHNGEQLQQCMINDIITFVAFQEVNRNNPVPTPAYFGERFIYDDKQDQYTCPAGNTMKSTGTWYTKKYRKTSSTQVKHYKTPACKTCPVRSECTTNPNGRIIDRSENAEAVEANNRRLLAQKELYQQRQQLCEHPFGTIKRQWGYDHILLKGLKKNNGEFGIIFLVYNFVRTLGIIGFQGLKKHLERCFLFFLTIRSTIQQYTSNIFSRNCTTPWIAVS
jgi:transposase